MKQSRDTVAEWMQLIADEGHGLTSWEEGFISDLSEQFDRTGSISDRQEEILERIYTEKTP